MILTERNLRQLIKQVITENEDDLVFTDEEANDVEKKYNKQQQRQQQISKWHKMSEYLLKMLNKNPNAFKALAEKYISYLKKMKRDKLLADAMKLMKVLDSDDFKTQLSYSKVDNYQDLCNQLMKHKAWSILVNWYIQSRTIETDSIKYTDPKRKVEIDPIKIKSSKNPISSF